MAIDIDVVEVERVEVNNKLRVKRLVLAVEGVEFTYRPDRKGKPKEVSRSIDDKQILEDSPRVSDPSYQKLCKKRDKIFSEERRLSKKRKRDQEFLQGTLF